MASQISIYLNEADKYGDRQLYWAVLEYLHKSGVAGATVLRAYAGFTGRGPLKTRLGGRGFEELPLVVMFIDSEARVDKVLPQLASMVGERLIVQQAVEVRHGLPGDAAAQRRAPSFK